MLKVKLPMLKFLVTSVKLVSRVFHCRIKPSYTPTLSHGWVVGREAAMLEAERGAACINR